MSDKCEASLCTNCLRDESASFLSFIQLAHLSKTNVLLYALSLIYFIQDALIQLGAKYAPCMRKDKELNRLLDKERQEEAETGCCIGTDQNGCIQKSQEQCKVKCRQ